MSDLSAEEVVDLLDLADDLKRDHPRAHAAAPLAGRTIAFSFAGSGFRTRATFAAGVAQLGGFGLEVLLGLAGPEPIRDVAGYLGLWVDAVIVRHPEHAAVAELACQTAFPVVNAMTDREHPCEVLADAQTLRERHGRLDGLELAFAGAPTNVFASWCHLVALLPLRLTLACPEGYEAGAAALASPRDGGSEKVTVTHDLRDAVRGADAVLTDGWPRADGGREREERDRLFAPYRVNSGIMALAKREAVLLPCPPVARGQEVSAEVVDGPRFAGYRAKENLLHVHKAIMLSLLVQRP